MVTRVMDKALMTLICSLPRRVELSGEDRKAICLAARLINDFRKGSAMRLEAMLEAGRRRVKRRLQECGYCPGFAGRPNRHDKLVRAKTQIVGLLVAQAAYPSGHPILILTVARRMLVSA